MARDSKPPSETELDRAGTELAKELLAMSPVDLRDAIEPDLRAPKERRADAAGCPCGCGESELIARAKEGDDVAVEQLLLRYSALARSKARSYFMMGADREDVVQEAMIGVYKAVRDFDESQGASFRTFAELCVGRQIISAVRAANRHKHAPLSGAVSLDRPVSSNDESMTLTDVLPAAAAGEPEALAVSADEMRALQRHIDEVLTDLEQQVLRHHVQGKSYDEIADMLQRHVKSVDNALQRIRRKMADHVRPATA